MTPVKKRSQTATIENLKKVFSFEKPKKVPTFLQYTTWPYAYAGVSLADVIDDPAAHAEAYTRFLDEIPFDITLFGAYEEAIRVPEVLGSDKFTIASDGVGIVHNQVNEVYLDESVYDRIIENPTAVMYNELAKKQIPAFSLPKEEALARLKDAVSPYLRDGEFKNLAMGKILGSGIVCAVTGGAPWYIGPFTKVFDYYRGIKNALIDLRRRPEKVQAACDAIMQSQAEAMHMARTAEEAKEQLTGQPMPMGINITNAECFLPRKFFYSLYIDYFKKYIGPYFEAGAKYFILGEGSLARNMDIYTELPKGCIALQLDEDNPYEMHKILKGKQVLTAGIDTGLMKLGSKEECIDSVKRAFDTLAPDHGYIFGNSRPLVAKNDAKVENIIAVYQTAEELSSSC